MTTKFPIYQFSVDHKLYPLVPKIMNLVDRGFKIRRSRIICQAITEWYEKRRHFYKAQVEGIYQEDVYKDLNLLEREMLLEFESLLPSIGEPLSAFRPSDTKMYYFMEGDLLNSIEQVSRLLKEGVDESRRIHGDEFGFLGSVPMSIRKMQWEQEWSSDEAREEAYFSALRNWRLEELKKLQAFMQEQAAKPQIG
jgi:hypothetical protein